jgi:hypothetical protein
MIPSAVQHDVSFARFLRRREQLKERLEETGRELDAWIADWGENEPPAAQLAHLAGLLQVRSGLFTEIKAVDDELLDHHLEQRGHSLD